MAIVVGLLCVTTATRWLRWDAWAPMPAVQALGHAAIWPALILLAYTAWTRRWRTAAAAGTLVVAHLALLVPWWLPSERVAVPADGDPLMVLASNLQYGRGDAATVVDAVRDLDVDVAVFVEATGQARSALVDAGLDELLPHEVDRTRPATMGALIRSRHPLETDGVPTLPRTIFEAPVVQVAAPDGDLLLLGAHPVPPWPGHTDIWRHEITAMAEWTARAPTDVPVIVAGDMNATMDHPELRQVVAPGFVNAHRAAGAGRPHTWPRMFPLPPVLHIDHVLVRGLDVADAGTLGVPGSDHAAVWARLVRP